MGSHRRLTNVHTSLVVLDLNQCREHNLRALFKHEVTHFRHGIDGNISDPTHEQRDLFLRWRRSMPGRAHEYPNGTRDLPKPRG